jgi:hypothetical protein
MIDVDGDSEVDRAAFDRERLPVLLGEHPRHHREVFGRLDDRPSDQMREGDLQSPVLQH